MGGGLRIRTIVAGAAALLSAAGAVVLGAPGAGAGSAQPLSVSVAITSQVVAGSACDWTVTFNVTLTNSSSSPVTVTSVDAGSYDPLTRTGGLAAGTVLVPGATTFTNLFSGTGTAEGPGCPAQAPDPLVLTVGDAAGTVTWNQSVSDPQVVTMTAVPQSASATLAGSFDVAPCSQYFFEWGTTTAYGNRAGMSNADCPNNAGTATQFTTFNLTGLASGTTYHYRLVVMNKGQTKIYGQDVSFTCGGTTVPVGSIGVIGLAALAGCALFLTQRRRHHRHAA